MSHPITRAEWFSASELAELRLPGLPQTKRKVNELAKTSAWPSRAARQAGGGREFPVAALPMAARIELVRCGRAPADEHAQEADAGTTERQRSDSALRMQVLTAVEDQLAVVGSVDRAVAMVSAEFGIGKSTIFEWRRLVKGLPRLRWPAALCPRRVGGRQKADIPAELWQFYESWWLRQSLPTHAETYRKTVGEAKRLGLTIFPSAKTFVRRAEQIPAEIVALKRGGLEATRLLVPPKERSVEGQHALQVINADGHKWDVGVRFPDGSKGRVITVAIQDVYSRKFLAWRHGTGESATLVRLVFMDLFAKWGVPEVAVLDNGRAFASKWITGGIDNRYRNKVLPGDPIGILPSFGIKVRWALPHRGSSKPIERGFRDFAQNIARHAAFDGAWLGNSVANKPENYGSALVDYADFVRVIDAEIAEHNARTGRETEMANGRSFDETFAESYALSIPVQATQQQLHDCMLSAEKVRGNRQTGAVSFHGNTYWTAGMAALAGKPLVIRYDPENLHSEVQVYDQRGTFILTAPIWEKVGFLTEDHGRARMKVERDLVKNARKEADLRDLLTAQELAHRALLTSPDRQEVPPPKVTRMLRTRGSLAVAAAPEASPAADPAFLDRLSVAVSRQHLRLIADE